MEIEEKYGTTELTSEQIDEFTELKTVEGLKDLEMKMAIQLASDYLAGMTDRSFVDIAVKTGFIKPDVIKKAKRGEILSDTVHDLIESHSQKGYSDNPLAQEKINDER